MSQDAKNDKKPWYSKSYDTNQLFSPFISEDNILNKKYDTDSMFSRLVGEYLNKPLWVKQAIYLEMRDDIKRMSDIELLEELDKNDLLQLYIPTLTTLGINIVKSDNYATQFGISSEEKVVLSTINGQRNVIDLCITHEISLKDLAKFIIKCYENGILYKIRSNRIVYLLKYLADYISFGEYLVKTGKITENQLYEANKKVEEMEKAFGDTSDEGLVNVLTRLGYIQEDVINNLLVLKKASLLQLEDSLNGAPTSKEMASLQESIDILIDQKNSLEGELEAYKNIIDAKDEKIKLLEDEISRYKQELETALKSNKSFLSKL